MDKAVLKGMLAAAAAAVSFMLAAFGGFALGQKLGILTPGFLVWKLLVPTGKVASIGGGIALQIAVDFVFWFALMCALYWLFRRLQRIPGR